MKTGTSSGDDKPPRGVCEDIFVCMCLIIDEQLDSIYASSKLKRNLKQT